jgi:hypothetical protein
MSASAKYKLQEITWPEFGVGAPVSYAQSATAEEYQSRIENARSKMAELGLTHLAVYGDREHMANLAYLTGLDPRFEEAVLVLSRTGTPLIIVGIECEGYLPASPLYQAGKLRSDLYTTFSLMNTPFKGARHIKDIFVGEGIGAGSRVGCAGWKYYADAEGIGGVHALDVPSYIADTLRGLAGYENVINAVGIFVDPDTGLRSTCSASEIAYFEYTNVLASEGMKRMHFGLKPGMTDQDLAKLAEYNGEPLGCHMTLASGINTPGLCGPSGRTIGLGDTLSWNICYWGSNICRVGWVAESDDDLPETAKTYVEDFAGPYFEASCQWISLLKVGAKASDFVSLIAEKLPYEKFGIVMNPGHLIHLDEWMSSPIYPGSEIKLHSGMMLQLDIIPSSKTFFSARMEEGFVLADEALRQELKEKYPDCFNRCLLRRKFMEDVLGIAVHEDVLPLSNMPCIVLPYLLKPNTVFAL